MDPKSNTSPYRLQSTLLRHKLQPFGKRRCAGQSLPKVTSRITVTTAWKWHQVSQFETNKSPNHFNFHGMMTTLETASKPIQLLITRPSGTSTNLMWQRRFGKVHFLPRFSTNTTYIQKVARLTLSNNICTISDKTQKQWGDKVSFDQQNTTELNPLQTILAIFPSNCIWIRHHVHHHLLGWIFPASKFFQVNL